MEAGNPHTALFSGTESIAQEQDSYPPPPPCRLTRIRPASVDACGAVI